MQRTDGVGNVGLAILRYGMVALLLGVLSYASLVASSMFVVTLSFLVTTPDVFQPSSPWGGFLMKDIMFLGAALLTGAEALGAVPAAQRARRVATA